MAEYKKSYNKVVAHEGGYVNDPDDTGGETYKGISRNNYPKWEGWSWIDSMKYNRNFPELLETDGNIQQMAYDFYRENFWNEIKGDQINSQVKADSIFDFAVNAGIKTSVSLAQAVVGSKPDGIIGPETLQKLNAFDDVQFCTSFALAKIARYVNIVKKRPASRKYFFGWVVRTLEQM